MVVDGTGIDVGIVELSTGLVTRRFGDDVVLLFVTPLGFARGEITFFHTTADCTGDRYLWNNEGSLAYAGYLSGATVFYTRLSDPFSTPASEPVRSYEIVRPGADPMAIGECHPGELGNLPIGPIVTAIDPSLGALIPPFRLK